MTSLKRMNNGWMHYPNEPKDVKRHNKLVLSSISTADLVDELATRDGMGHHIIRISFEIARGVCESPKIEKSWQEVRMTERICPFMSGVYSLPDGYRELADVYDVYCIGERCMAWGECGRNDAGTDPIIMGCRLIP